MEKSEINKFIMENEGENSRVEMNKAEKTRIDIKNKPRGRMQ